MIKICIKNESKEHEETFKPCFHEFTKSDYLCYQGASTFKDGSAPMIANFYDEDVTIIVSGGDNNLGKPFIELNFYDDDSEECFAYGAEYEDKNKAIVVANLITKEVNNQNIIDLDDIEDIVYSYNLSKLTY